MPGVFFSPAFASSSVNVPLDNWVYPALEKLESYNLIRSALPGIKPYSRLEAARLVAEAMENWENSSLRRDLSTFAAKKLLPSLLRRLKSQFLLELVDRGDLKGVKTPTYWKPVEEVTLKYVYQSDNPAVRSLPPLSTISALYNNDGMVYGKGNNGSLELQGEGRYWNHISFSYKPILKVLPGENTQIDLRKGYLKLEFFNLELEAGRDSLWWGPGNQGDLLLTNNARPFNLLKLSNPYPSVFPILGPLKFTLFLTQTDNGQPFIPNPWLLGTRLYSKPHPLLELGISYLVLFGGEGRGNLSLGDYFTVIFTDTSRDHTFLDSNKELSLDIALRWPDLDRFLPLARSLRIYGEIGAEDRGILPDRRAFILGLALYDLLTLGRVDLRVEYANTAPHSLANAWYFHGIYPFYYHGRIFGHHVGTNGENVFARLNGYLTADLAFGLDFNLETQGKREALSTQSFQAGLDMEYLLRERIRLKARYIHERLRDPFGLAGGDQERHFGIMEIRWIY